MNKIYFSLKMVLLMTLIEFFAVASYLDKKTSLALLILLFFSFGYLLTIYFIFSPYVKYDSEQLMIYYTYKGKRKQRWKDAKSVYSTNQIAYFTMIFFKDGARIMLGSFMTRRYLDILKEVLDNIPVNKVDEATKEILKKKKIDF